MNISILILVVIGTIWSLEARANDQSISSIDISSIYQSGSSVDNGFLNFFGLDFTKDFSNETEDYGELLMQVYVASASNLEVVPGFFDSPNDTPIQFRNFYFKYKGFNRGKTQIKIGHFELPFGLEHQNDTNSTLRQYGNQFDPGIKVDWGVSAQGYFSNYVYEVAITRGSGNEWEDSMSPYLVTGRVGTNDIGSLDYGFSWLKGRVARPNGTVSDRERVSIDISWYHGDFALMGQHYIGKNDDMKIKRSLLEANMNYGFDEWLVYGQWHDYSKEQQSFDDSSWLTLGLRWEPDSHWLIELEHKIEFDAFAGRDKLKTLRTQLRYRF